MATRKPPAAVLLILWAACGPAGCAARVRPIVADRPIALNEHSLRLHFANPNAGTSTDASRPLLVFATGDGGMHRKDLDAYHHLVALGYPIVGFDAHDYVTHLGPQAGTTPARLGGLRAHHRHRAPGAARQRSGSCRPRRSLEGSGALGCRGGA